MGIDSILKSISCSPESVKKLTNVGYCMAGSFSKNENAMEQRCSHNQPSATFTRPTEFVSPNQGDANDYVIDSFDFSYLDSPHRSFH